MISRRRGPLQRLVGFEITDLLLAGLAIAALIGAIGLITPSVDLVDRRCVPWIVGAAFVLVANALLRPAAAFGRDRSRHRAPGWRWPRPS